MRINLLLVNTLALVLATNIAAANTYQTEVDAGFNLIDYDDFQGPGLLAHKSENWQVSATYHFKEVNLNGHPLAEAGFLEKSSNFTLAYENYHSFYNFESGDFTIEGGGSSFFTTGDSTNRFTSADIEFYIPNSIFYLGGHIEEGYYKFKSKDEYGNNQESFYDIETVWSLRLGLAPITGLLVWTELLKDQDFDKEWNVNAKYVTDLGGNAINLEGSYTDAEHTDIASIAADYYLDQSFSIGLVYERHQEDLMGDFYGLRTRKFFTENLALNAAYTKSDYADSYNLGITYRF